MGCLKFNSFLKELKHAIQKIKCDGSEGEERGRGRGRREGGKRGK